MVFGGKKTSVSLSESLRRATSTSFTPPQTIGTNSNTKTIVETLQDTADQLTSSALDLLGDGSTTDQLVNPLTGETEQQYLDGAPSAPIPIQARTHVAVTHQQTSIGDAISNAIDGVFGDVSHVTNPVNNYLGDVGDSIDQISDAISDAVNTVADIPNSITDLVNGTEAKIEHAVQTVETRIQVIKDDITNPIRRFGHDLFADLKYALIFGGIAFFFIWQGTSGLRHEAFTSAKSLGKRAFNEAVNAAPKVAPLLLV
jgi:hypothetical protein